MNLAAFLCFYSLWRVLFGVTCLRIACFCTFHIFSTWTDRNEKSHFHSSFYVYYQSVFIWHFRTEIILHSTLLILIFTNISCVRHHCQTHSMNLADFPCFSFFFLSFFFVRLEFVDMWGIIWCCMTLYGLRLNCSYILSLNW